ncbi:MAG: DUF5686 family protein [Calditrichaceae bacterium]
MQRSHLSCILLFLFCFCLPSFAQVIISGSVSDAETGQLLPAANLQIEGTYRGTITNEDGKFRLETSPPPVTLIITYIGYETKKILIHSESDRQLHITLRPVVLESDPIIVIAEDPAMGIMREVIKRKLEWQKRINTYKADAYTRVILENDSGIVSIAESISETFWDKKQGAREIIKSRRQTGNLKSDDNFAFSSYFPNLYNDDIRIQGSNLIGPTHPKAFDYYEFKLTGKRYLDSTIVFDIEVIPTTKLQPVFVGNISVLDSFYCMIEANLKPDSRTTFFPPPVQDWNLYYKQQFSNFGKEFWLPVDIRVNGDIKFGITGLDIPRIKYKQVGRLTDYQINVMLPDSLYLKKDILTLDTLSVKNDTMFALSKEIVPLSASEENAYEEIDSTDTLEKAFKPTGVLAKLVSISFGNDDNGENNGQGSLLNSLSPQLWFNRVDGLHAGITFKHNFKDNWEYSLTGAYNTDLDKGSFEAGLKYLVGRSRSGWIGLNYSSGSLTRYESETYSRTVASVLPLLAKCDYFDYYWNESVQMETGYRFEKINSIISAAFASEEHSSLSKNNDYNLLGYDFTQRINPEIDEGQLRSLTLTMQYGDNFIPFGLIGQTGAKIAVEYSSPDILNSDFSFTKITGSIDFHINTFLTRRLFPNALNIHITGGVSDGELPVQRFGILDAGLSIFSPFAAFRSVRNSPYEGEDYLALFWEHNFRTVPFELIGLRFLADRNIGILLHGAHGSTHISDQRKKSLDDHYNETGGIHHELGISVNGLLGLFRMDITKQLDTKDFYVGFGLFRWL